MNDQPPAIPPSTPLTVTMTITQWRELLDHLADGAFRKVGPWIGQIERQCNHQLASIVPAMRGNGAATEERQPDA
jgi:hypothetical protein